MSTPGHPFKTQGMDEVRSRQRRLVRKLDDRIFGSAIGGRYEALRAIAGDDRTTRDLELIEAELRVLVDKELKELAEIPADLGEDHGREQLSLLFSSLRSRGYAVDDLVKRQAGARVTRIPANFAPMLDRVVQLLVVADELAEDGYKDPRLSR